MPGLVPGIHALLLGKGVDGRDKPGHDEGWSYLQVYFTPLAPSILRTTAQSFW
jgi:hypothetical protein